MFKRIGATILTIVMLLSMTSVYSLAAESEKMGLEVSLVDGNNNPRYYVTRGEVIQAVVKIKNPSAIRGIAVGGFFDDTPFELAGNPICELLESNGVELKPQNATSGNNVLVAWTASNAVQLQNGAVLMTVPLRVKQDAALNKETISFKITDVYIQGAGGKSERLADGDGYNTEPADAQVVVSETLLADTSLAVTAKVGESDETVAVVGDNITVTVNVKDYHDNWSWMTIEGLYDQNVLQLVGEPVCGDFKSGIDKKPTCNTDHPGAIGVTWMNEEIVTKNQSEFTALTLTFKVIGLPQEGNDEPLLSFFFDEEGIYGEGEQLVAAGFKKDRVEPELEITDAKTYLTVSADKEKVHIGEEVIVKVDVTDYENNCAIMTIMGEYDNEKFDLIKTEYQTLSQGIAQAPAIVDNKDGILAVTWFDTNNLVLDPNDSTVLTLTFRAMAGAENAAADFNFYFDPEGTQDANGNEVGGFSAAKVSDTVTMLPLLSENAAKLNVDVADVAYIGNQVHVHVNVKNYANLWSGMTIQGTYNKDQLSVNKILPKRFVGDADDWTINSAPDGQISVSWSNDSAVQKDATEFEVLEVVFDILNKGANNEASFAFSIAEVKDDNGEIAPATWYDASEVSDSVSLKNIKLNVEASAVRAKVGSQVKYKVSLDGYQDNWLGMAIEAVYDPNVLEIADNGVNSLINLDPLNGETFLDDTSIEGTVQAVWVYSKAKALGLTPDVLELTFNVIGEGDGSTEVFFKFKEDGIVAIDPDGKVHEPVEDAIETEEVEMDLNLFTESSLEIVGNESVARGEEYTVELKLKEYKKNWSSFGVEFEYDATVFEIEDPADIVAPSFGGAPVMVDATTPGKIRLDWSNAENISADEETVILTVTFMAKEPKEKAVFNATLVDVKTFDGTTHEDVNPYEYKANATPLEVQIKRPYLSLEVAPSMNEGEIGELKIYLHEYTNNWNSIPVVLTYDAEKIRLKEDWIICNALGGIAGVKVLNAEAGMIVLTWLDTQNITAEGEKIELATIPFKAHKDGDAKFDAYFEENNLYTRNPQGGYDSVEAGTYVADAKTQTVTIADQYESMAVPMSLTVETANPAIKGKKETLALKLDNFNPRVGAFSVKLFYEKDKVTVSDIQEMLGDNANIVGVSVLNEDEGYVQFTWVASGKIMANESNPTIATICYTAANLGEVSFHAEFVQVIDNNKKAMDPEWDYVVCGKTTTVEVKEIPSMNVTVENSGVIKIGDTVTVTVSVKDYLDRWSDMTINGSYDKNLLRLISVTPTDLFDNRSCETGEGSFKATLSNNATNVIAGSDFDALTLVFKVIDSGSKGEAKIDISFGEILTNGTTPLIPDADYRVKAEGADEINIQICNHNWSKYTHKGGTFGAASKHILTCANGCGLTKEETCAIETTAINPNCTMAGSIIYSCSLCGYNQTLTDPNAPALGHKFDGKPVHKTGTGKHIYTCTQGCGATKEEICTNKTQVVQSTCITDGYTINTCTVCNYSYNSDIDKAKGEHSALTLHYIAPTESTNGSIITQCDICKEYVVPPYAGAVRKTLKAGHPFPDVQDPASWYYKEVIFNKAFDIFGGDEKGNFNPTSNITRGQLVTVLGRIMKAEAEKSMSAAEFNAFLDDQTSKVSGMKSASGFTDLGGKYYERYAKLFAKWGIVNGYPDGTFRGDKKITREEMATLIKRFVEAYRDSTQNITFGNAATFKDFAKVSDWAKSNVEWVGKVGLFQGNAEKNYNPKSNATRAEIAVVIYRMLPVLKNICVCSLNH